MMRPWLVFAIAFSVPAATQAAIYGVMLRNVSLMRPYQVVAIDCVILAVTWLIVLVRWLIVRRRGRGAS
jgi:hypothetical protein